MRESGIGAALTERRRHSTNGCTGSLYSNPTSFLHRSSSPMPPLCRMAFGAFEMNLPFVHRLFSDIHEASRSVSHDQPRVNGQHLAPPHEPIHSTTRESHSHVTRESRSHFVVPRGEQSNILSQSRSSRNYFCELNPSSTSVRGLLARNPGSWASACSARLAGLLVMVVVVIKTQLLHGWLVNAKT